MALEILKQLKIAFLLLLLLTIITGIIYPLIVTGIAQIFFPWQASGSLIKQDGKIIGSALIGQAFDDPRYFWSRPSATTPFPYNAAASSGSNLGPTNPELFAAIKKRIEAVQQTNPDNHEGVPIDLITTSGSGLDPDISPGAAFYQVPRIAKARNLSENQLNQLIQQMIKNRQWGFLGEPRVNVLELNLALDEFSRSKFHGTSP